MEQKDLNGIAVNCPDNPDAGELTETEMEKVAAGGFTFGLDCFICPGDECGCTLRHFSGNIYRCVNPLCPLFGQDQYPSK